MTDTLRTCLCLVLWIFWVTLPLGRAPAAPTAGSRPHILVILADDLGYGDLGCYGASDLLTPHLDRLAARGMRLDSFYANAPVCSPTRAALLTGRYPDLVGVPGVIRTHPENNWGYLLPTAPLLPQTLKKAGYHTALIGKWHLGLASPNTPNERGFDYFHGFLGDMMDDYYKHERHGIRYMRENGRDITPTGHATDLFTQWAIEYLHSRGNAPDPFFLYLAYNAPHTPIQPPPDWLERVRQRDPAMNPTRARLVALIEHLDDGIGRVLQTLSDRGLAGRTLVLFTSDNGGQLDVGARCGPYRGGKQDLYEGGLRVPFCVVWPEQVTPGSRSAAVALTMDIFPTLCEAAGAPTPTPMNGISLLGLLTGRSDTLPDRDLVWMRREGGNRYRARDYYALRRDSWKLVQNHPFEPYQLYNLAEDPREEKDLARQEKSRYEELAKSLQRHVQAAGAVPWQGPP